MSMFPVSIRNKLTVVLFAAAFVPLAAGLSWTGLSQARALERDLLSQTALVAALASEYGAADLAFDDAEACTRTLALAEAFNTMVAEVAHRQEALQHSQEALRESLAQLAQAQQELVAKERLAAVGQLSAVMAHEVRNPLWVIFNSLEALDRQVGSAGPPGELLGILREEAKRLNQIVEDLLDFARPAPPEQLPKSLGPILASAVEVATCNAPAQHYRVTLEVAPGLPPVPVDERMIRQALINLVLNAVQAMPEGGEIAVRAVEEKSGARAFARVEVSDRGPGMTAETAARVFLPFFTTKASGTGLGLAVVRRFVEAHGGEISVETIPGQGSTFALKLPLSAEPSAARARRS